MKESNSHSNHTANKIAELHQQVKTLIKEGKSDEQIIHHMDQYNLQPYYIETIIQNLREEDIDRKSFRNSLIMGFFYITAGLSLNILSYKYSADNNTSIFYCFWGIVVFGIVTIIRGFILHKR